MSIAYVLWAPLYDSILDRVFSFDRRRTMSRLRPKRGEHILELAVGTGLNLPLYPQGVYVTGIDASKAMLRHARKKRAEAFVKLREADANSLPFPAGTFDKVYATFFFRILPDPRTAISEARRVLKKEGLLVVVDTFRTDAGSRWDGLTWLLGWGKNLPPGVFRGWKIESSTMIGKTTRVITLQKTLSPPPPPKKKGLTTNSTGTLRLHEPMIRNLNGCYIQFLDYLI